MLTQILVYCIGWWIDVASFVQGATGMSCKYILIIRLDDDKLPSIMYRKNKNYETKFYSDLSKIQNIFMGCV